MTRREFVTASAVGLAGLSTGSRPIAAEAGAVRNKLIAFTKPFDTFSPEATADLVAEVGWDGVELAIRKYRGHVQPEKVEDDLPRMAEALKRRDKAITIATTEVTALNPAAERVLRAVAKSGIETVRLGFFHYAKDRQFESQLADLDARLRDIAAACRELGLRAGFQNHSGADLVGAGIWDAWSLIKAIPEIGFCFDLGHATVEGGLSWPTEARLARPEFVAVYLKDFLWEKGVKGWNAQWVPLGEGMVDPQFFKWLRTTNYSGPICQHHEYDHGSGETLRKHLKDDFATLKRWLA